MKRKKKKKSLTSVVFICFVRLRVDLSDFDLFFLQEGRKGETQGRREGREEWQRISKVDGFGWEGIQNGVAGKSRSH